MAKSNKYRTPRRVLESTVLELFGCRIGSKEMQKKKRASALSNLVRRGVDLYELFVFVESLAPESRFVHSMFGEDTGKAESFLSTRRKMLSALSEDVIRALGGDSPDALIPITEVAARFALPLKVVTDMVNRGELVGNKINGEFFVQKTELDNFLVRTVVAHAAKEPDNTLPTLAVKQEQPQNNQQNHNNSQAQKKNNNQGPKQNPGAEKRNDNKKPSGNQPPQGGHNKTEQKNTLPAKPNNTQTSTTKTADKKPPSGGSVVSAANAWMSGKQEAPKTNEKPKEPEPKDIKADMPPQPSEPKEGEEAPKNVDGERKKETEAPPDNGGNSEEAPKQPEPMADDVSGSEKKDSTEGKDDANRTKVIISSISNSMRKNPEPEKPEPEKSEPEKPATKESSTADIDVGSYMKEFGLL